jgi:hypothetical protein
MQLFVIKSFHRLVFIVESIAILFIIYSGIFNVGGTLLIIALILVVAEIVVFVANGQRFPLTKLALRLGDKTGDDYIADFLFPQWLKPYVSPICGGLALIGFVVILARVMMQ